MISTLLIILFYDNVDNIRSSKHLGKTFLEKNMKLLRLEKAALVMKNYSKLPFTNCSYVHAWLTMNKYMNVAIYFPKVESLGQWLVKELEKQSDVRVSIVTDLVGVPNTTDAIIVPNFEDVPGIRSVFENGTAKIISLDFIIRQLNECTLIERLYHLQMKGVQTLVLEMPCSGYVRNPSQWEQILNEKKFNNGNAGRKYTKQIYEDGSLNDGGQMKCKDYVVRGNKRSLFVNVINHIRPATQIPVHAIHDIHIVGDSTAVGFYVMDDDTIASYLQHIINKVRHDFSCLIYAGSGIPVEVFERRLREIKIEKNDIVVIIGHCGKYTADFIKSCEENGVPFYCSQNDYHRPHAMGEVFISGGHPNAQGNRKTGEILFDKLFLNPSKLHFPESFQHHYCGSLTSSTSQANFKEVGDEGQLQSNSFFLLFMRSLEVFQNNSMCAGVVVMNCNPFTLGHLYLNEIAAAQVDSLFVFVVEEDKSQFLFTDRFRLCKAGTTHLPNTLVLPSSMFVISSRTLPEYFFKGENPDTFLDATADLEIFTKWVAPALGVSVRFVGEEPFDRVTLQYNEAMKRILPRFGLLLKESPRREHIAGGLISASRVRALMKEGNYEKILPIIPQTTLAYFWQGKNFTVEKRCKF